jgi:hypothetical protein
MRATRCLLTIALLSCVCVCPARPQDEGISAATEPPRVLLLVHQEFQAGKASARQKLEIAISRACDRISVPNAWIDLEAITGRTEAMWFDPFDSFEDMDKAAAEWPRIYATNPDIARLQEELQALVVSERSVIAVRRDDVGYRANTIDLSKIRTMRILEVHLFPGHESDFVEAFRDLGAAYERMGSNTPWVVYQVNAGEPSPAFLVFVPMTGLKQNDDLLSRRGSLLAAEGEEGARHMQEIAREAYAGTESNLYAVSPEPSHVSKEFAAGDPEFWKHRSSAPAERHSAKKADENHQKQ